MSRWPQQPLCCQLARATVATMGPSSGTMLSGAPGRRQAGGMAGGTVLQQHAATSWKPHPHHLLHHLQLGAVLGISHAATATGACTIAPCPCSCAACILHEPAPRWVDRLHVAVHGVGCHPCLHRTIGVTSSQAARISPHAQLQAMQHCCRATSALIS